jgi:hypothetical protein
VVIIIVPDPGKSGLFTFRAEDGASMKQTALKGKETKMLFVTVARMLQGLSIPVGHRSPRCLYDIACARNGQIQDGARQLQRLAAGLP